jgi:transcriptional regulator with XRE-family HTH domain
VTPGELIKSTRERHRLSQTRVARRAGTQQSAISRIEADQISPTVETLSLLMHSMGERLEISPAPLERDYDPVHRKAAAARSPAQRLALSISWNRMAGRLREAGRAARG